MRTFTEGHALLIGVGGDLAGSVDDATGLATLLCDPERCAYSPARVRLLTGAAAGRGDVLAALTALAQAAGPDDTILIYFSGHGCRVETPFGASTYLLTHGYEVARLAQTAISGAELAAYLGALPSRNLLLLLDCCHAGHPADMATGAPAVLSRAPMPLEVANFFAAGEGRVAIVSSLPGELSCTGKPYGAFALALAEALCGMGRTTDDGEVRVHDLVRYICRTVPQCTGKRQHPAANDLQNAANFSVAYYAGGRTLAQELPFVAGPVESEPTPTSLDVARFDQREQTVYGPQTNIGGSVAGNVYSGHIGHIGDVVTNIFSPTAAAPPPPFQAPPPAADHVSRSQEVAQIVALLLDEAGTLLANTVGLHGIGGAGKTTLARLVCAQAEVRRACADGILWLPLGKSPAEPRVQIADLVTALTGACNGCATLNGAQAQLQAALAGRQVLMVIDDVWDEADLRPFLEASPACARLITTRNTLTLPFEAFAIDVGVMAGADARRLLGAGLPGGHEASLDALAARLGRWPVLLRLANRTLRQRIQFQKTPPAQAIDAANALIAKSILAFDVANPSQRDQAVAATVEASLELLDAEERQRCLELAIFPQDVPIPLEVVSRVWALAGGWDEARCQALVADRLDPLSLVEFDGGLGTLRLHDVLRSYLYAVLDDKASLHRVLADDWGDWPAATNAYAWRWLAYHRARAAQHTPQPQCHALAAHLVELVEDPGWQQAHQQALSDLPALREALVQALEAAVADDEPAGVALMVRAADALVRFRRDSMRTEPIFRFARQGALAEARRHIDLLTVDDHWRHALLLAVAWLAPAHKRAEARDLCAQVALELGPFPELHNLLLWVNADLDEGGQAPVFPLPVPPSEADALLVEQLVKRVGGWAYHRELLISRGLDPDVVDPDRPRVPPTAGLYHGRAADPDTPESRSTTRYLAELDGPYLITHAAQDPVQGMAALQEYLSVYTNYNYPEYRYSTLWLLLGFVTTYPRPDSNWVQEATLRLLAAAIDGDSVEFSEGVAVAVQALRAHGGDLSTRQVLVQEAHRLMGEATSLKPGREREGSDIWAYHKRLMLAHAQALGWLLGEKALAEQVLKAALDLADSGFAGYQAPACLALAETIHICTPGRQPAIEEALAWAQNAAHNVQDLTFCARMTARVNAMRRYWWSGFNLGEALRRLPDAAYLPRFVALHQIGHDYQGRRGDALHLPEWATTGAVTFDALARLYQRPRESFLRLNNGEQILYSGDEVAVPDPGLLPHIAARLAAEVLATAGAPLAGEQLRQLRSLVVYALPSPTALDAVLARLILAHGKGALPFPEEALADLEAAIAQRPPPDIHGPQSELLAHYS